MFIVIDVLIDNGKHITGNYESTPKSRKMLIFNPSLPRPLKGKC